MPPDDISEQLQQTAQSQGASASQIGSDASAKLKDSVKFLTWVMGGVILVLGVGYITLLVMVTQMAMGTYHDKQTDYQRLTDQVQAQNAALNAIQKQLGH